HRPTPAVQLELADLLDELPAGRDDAVLGQHQLGERLVERHREPPGAGAGVREAQLIEQSRIERLAEAAAAALGRVEDEVGRERLQPGSGAAGGTAHLDALHPVSEPLHRRGERGDGLPRVELGFFLGIGEAQVVRQGDAHASSDGPAFAGSPARATGGSSSSLTCAAREAASPAAARAAFCATGSLSPSASEASITCVPAIRSPMRRAPMSRVSGWSATPVSTASSTARTATVTATGCATPSTAGKTATANTALRRRQAAIPTGERGDSCTR